MTQRTDRVDELLRQEIGSILARDIGDPRIGFVTITDIETVPDLSHAQVWVSVIGTAEERKEALSALGRAMPFVRRELGRRLRLRRIPELHLRADDTLERGTRVLQLLNELEAGADPAELEVPEPILPTPVPRLPHEGDAPPPAGADAFPPAPSQRRRPRSGSTGGVPTRRTNPRRRGGPR